MPDTKSHNTLRGPPWCRLCQCIALFAAYLTFLSYLIKWVSSDQTCKSNIVTLSGWNCLFWEHGVNILYFLFFTVFTLAIRKAAIKAGTVGGINNYEILFHSINNIPIIPWTIITWHRIGKLVSCILAADTGAERPQWVESLLRIVGSSIITTIIYLVILIVLVLVLLVLAVVCFFTPIWMLSTLCRETLESRRDLLAQRHIEPLNLELHSRNGHLPSRGNAVVRELVEGYGEHRKDEEPGDKSYQAEHEVEDV